MLETGLKTSKFGGSSLATADMIRTVIGIVRSDPSRRVIVVSAPGTRFKGDIKMTDLLAGWATNGCKPDDGHYLDVEHRFRTIARELGLIDFDLDGKLDRMKKLSLSASAFAPDLLSEYAMSRGEWLNAQMIAHVLGYSFIDAADFISFNDQTYNHEETQRRALRARVREKAVDGIVIPGFYGSTVYKTVRTFPRDGSDITGSILAALTRSSVYENFSDVNGFLSTSPKIVEDPAQITEMTYEEARELSFMGSPILQPRAVKYAKDLDIPIHVRKTDRNLPEGTWIRPWIDAKPSRPVTGIAVRKNGTILTLSKDGMDDEVGFLAQAASVFSRNGIGVHNCPGSVDTLSFIVLDPIPSHKIPLLAHEIETSCGCQITMTRNVSVICVVGRGMSHTPGVAAKITGALSKAGINIVMLNQGSSERNVEIGVDDQDAERAVQAIYDAFFRE